MKRFYLVFAVLAIVNIVVDRPAQAQSTPIQIYNCQGLQKINNNLSVGYQLANDIDCSGVAFNPIGGTFTGTLDGQGHTISNLTIQEPQSSSASVGLFSVISGGTVENLHIVSASILPPVYSQYYASPSDDTVGIVAGSIQFGATINNVTVQGNITTVTGSSTGTGATAGGVAGTIWQATIHQSSADVTVSAEVAGGLVGYDAGTIDQSFSTGTVIGCVSGGLVGLVGSVTSPDVIENSYSQATVITTNDPSIGVTGLGMNGGGLVGLNGADYAATVVNSYASGPVSSQIVGSLNTTLSLGGDQGSNYQYATWSLNSIYWDVNATQQLHSADSPDSNGKSTSQMYQQVTYYGWDFTNTWVSGIQQYPVLIWQERSQIDLWNTFSAAYQESIYDQGPPNTVNWSNLDNISGADGINWTDILVLSRPPVWSYQSATATSGFVNSVNWTYLGALSDSSINWGDVVVLSRLGIDWASVNPLVKSGINWSDWEVSTTSGINWNDLVISSRTGINWDTLSINNKAGTNWPDWAAMTKIGINWFDVSVLSNLGVNWNSIGNLTDPINLGNLAGMTKQGINWNKVNLLSNENVNWDNTAILNAIPMTSTDLHTLRTIGVNTNGTSPAIPKVQLVLYLTGDGMGTFTSMPAGLYCYAGSSNACSASFPLNHQPVTINFSPLNNSSITNWGGCKNPTSTSCSVTLDQNIDLNIVVSQNFTINTSTYGAGSATFLCNGSACPASVPGGTSIVFTVHPNPGTIFESWANYCTAAGGTANGASCTVDNISSNLNLTAILGLAPPTYTITTSTAGPGSGNVLCNGGTCPKSVVSGTVITFTGQPDKGSILEGLGGVCAAPGGPIFTCPFDVTSNISVSAYFIKSPPPPPTDLTAKKGAAGITLSWGTKYGISFNVYRAEIGLNSSRYSLIKYVGYPNTTYTDNTMPNDGLYLYYVTGVYYPNIESSRSNIATVIWIDPNKPSTPIGLTATTSTGQVDLSWNTSPGADDYYVKRALVGTNGKLGTYTIISVISSNPTQKTVSFRDRSVVNGKTYYYMVAAQNAKGISAYTAPVSIKAK